MTRNQKCAQWGEIRRSLALMVLAFVVLPIMAAYLVEYIMPACK